MAPWIVPVALLIAGAAFAAPYAVPALFPASNCDAVEKAKTAWLDRRVNSRDELQEEIRSLILDNKCDGITPQTLRKVLLDMTEVK